MEQSEYEIKAEELSKTHGCKVRPIIFKDDETSEDVVGYVKEPSRLVKIRVMDKLVTSPITAAAELLDIILLKDDSDPRIYSEKPENDKYYLGASLAAVSLVQLSNDLFKKK